MGYKNCYLGQPHSGIHGFESDSKRWINGGRRTNKFQKLFSHESDKKAEKKEDEFSTSSSEDEAPLLPLGVRIQSLNCDVRGRMPVGPPIVKLR